MDNRDQLSQIAERIKYMRELLDMTDEEVAKKIDMPIETYRAYENLEKDIPISMIYNVSAVLNIDPTELILGEAPRMSNYTVTRKGQGLEVERFKGYSFESLAFNFKNRNKEPMIVTISPSEGKPQLVCHGGQEFNLVLQGKIGITIGGKEIILSEGDSVYFDPSIPHGQFAVDEESKFLTVIDKE